jgi:hypothetical protein
MLGEEGEEGLLKGGEVVQHPLTALAIEFQEHVVEEEEGLASRLLEGQGGLGNA